jgi:hypothetical protein
MTIRSNVSTTIDAGVTLLAGSAAAFVLFAMPEALLGRGLAALRLASFSPRFQPPLGQNVRLAIAAAAGLLVLGFVWSLMKALERKPAADKAAADSVIAAPAPDPEAPRLRKADAHPDAPARRPLIAGRDLGEPLDLDQPLDLTAEDALEATPEEEEEEFVPQPEPLPAATPIPQEPAADPLPPFLVAQEPEETSDQPEQPVQSVAHGAPESDEESIVSLMHRFETGLVRKKQALADHRPDPVQAAPRAAPAATAAPAYAPPAPEPAAHIPAPVGHRLRTAIAGLQKSAGR